MVALNNSRFLRIIPLLITISSSSFPAYAQYSGGTGEPNDPFQIAAAADEVIDFETARNLILKDVSQIKVLGVPGRIAVFGDQAFGVIHDGEYHPMLAGAVLGKGRIVIFGHPGYNDFSRCSNSPDTQSLYLNLIEWVSGISGTQVRVVTTESGTKSWLEAQGFTNVSKYNNWVNHLTNVDIAVINVKYSEDFNNEKIEALFDFVASGGGLITGGGGWIFEDYGGYSLKELPVNRFLRLAGLGYASGSQSSTDATQRCTEFANAVASLEVMQNPTAYTDVQKNEAVESLKAVIDVLPEDDPIYINILDTVISRASELTPTPSDRISNSVDQLALMWESDLILNLPVEETKAHRTAEAVYGYIEPSAQRVSQNISFDVSQPGFNTYGDSSEIWLSTGLYAAPGEIVEITIPERVTAMQMNVRINGDWNDISKRSSYWRMPFGISREFAITETTLQVANAYGGLIYIVVPKDTEPGRFDVTIHNAVRAPYFILGEHTNQDWIDTISQYPGTYAEIASNNFILTVRASSVRDIDNIEQLAQYWEEVVLAQDYLAGVTDLRTRPERAYDMIQTAWGGAYAGYPIGMWNWQPVDYESLKEDGHWGLFHELGHLHQSSYWTFEGALEVTVNIFSMFAAEEVTQLGRASGSWGQQWDSAFRIEEFQDTQVKGGFDQGDFSEKLVMFSQLKHVFGWDAYRTVFRQYLNTPAEKLPTNDQEERDQWMTRFSDILGLDISPFFIDWNFGVSQAAIDSLAGLPKWTMAEMVNDHFTTPQYTNVIIKNLLDNDFSFDRVLTLKSLGDPSNGTLVDNHNGTYTYTPLPQFLGEDTFTYTVQNGFGNIFTGTVKVVVF